MYLQTLQFSPVLKEEASTDDTDQVVPKYAIRLLVLECVAVGTFVLFKPKAVLCDLTLKGTYIAKLFQDQSDERVDKQWKE